MAVWSGKIEVMKLHFTFKCESFVDETFDSIGQVPSFNS